MQPVTIHLSISGAGAQRLATALKTLDIPGPRPLRATRRFVTAKTPLVRTKTQPRRFNEGSFVEKCWEVYQKLSRGGKTLVERGIWEQAAVQTGVMDAAQANTAVYQLINNYKLVQPK